MYRRDKLSSLPVRTEGSARLPGWECHGHKGLRSHLQHMSEADGQENFLPGSGQLLFRHCLPAQRKAAPAGRASGLREGGTELVPGHLKKAAEQHINNRNNNNNKENINENNEEFLKLKEDFNKLKNENNSSNMELNKIKKNYDNLLLQLDWEIMKKTISIKN